MVAKGFFVVGWVLLINNCCKRLLYRFLVVILHQFVEIK